MSGIRSLLRLRFWARCTATSLTLYAVRAEPLSSQAGAPAAPPPDSVILELLRARSPELASRRAGVQWAEARLRATRFGPPATLSMEAEEVPRGADLSRATVRLGLEREFLPRGVRGAARSVSETELRTAREQLRLAELGLLAQARRGMVRIAGGERSARRFAAEDSLLEGAEAALRSRFSVGEARYVDVLRLRTERLRIQSDRAQALAQVQAGRRILEALLGGDLPPETRAALERATQVSLDGILPDAPDTAALQRSSPAIRLAELAVERARATRGLIAAGQRPRLSASAGVQRFEGEDGYGAGPTLGLSVSLPGTARSANRSALGAADAAIAAAEAEHAARVASVRGALTVAASRYEAARARLALFDAALLRGARQEREAALAAYASGELSLLELIDFERALARAELERIQALTDAADAFATLLSAAAASDADATPRFQAPNDDDR